jgi:hypothetical protein
MITYRINQQERLFTLRYAEDVSVAGWQNILVHALAACPELPTY